MVLWRKLLSGGLAFCFGLLIAACSSLSESAYWRVEPGHAIEPTSLVLANRTPKPSLTPTATRTPTATPTKNFDLDYYYGGQTVTMDDVGRILPLRLGESFSLYLGSGYTWQVVSQPEYLISQNLKITPAPGEQGIFVARQRGQGLLKAIGEPACRQQQPPCERPSVLFQIHVVIE